MKYAKVFGIFLSAGLMLVSYGEMQDGADVSQSGIVWGNQWLVPVGTDSAAGGEVTLEDPHWTDEFLRVMAVNNGSRELRINVEEEVHMKLEGEWYAVPYLPGTVLGDTIVALSSGKKEPVYCYLEDDYGELPSGDYRIAVQMIWMPEKKTGQSAGNNGSAEAEKFWVYHEFTIE